MCLYIDDSIHTLETPLLAEKDILVWKILYNTNDAMYQKFIYKENKMYQGVLEILRGTIAPHARVYAGFHAWKTRNIARDEYHDHGYDRRLKIVKMWIPKGAHYFIGTNGDIVSNQIMTKSLEKVR